MKKKKEVPQAAQPQVAQPQAEEKARPSKALKIIPFVGFALSLILLILSLVFLTGVQSDLIEAAGQGAMKTAGNVYITMNTDAALADLTQIKADLTVNDTYKKYAEILRKYREINTANRIYMIYKDGDSYRFLLDSAYSDADPTRYYQIGNGYDPNNFGGNIVSNHLKDIYYDANSGSAIQRILTNNGKSVVTGFLPVKNANSDIVALIVVEADAEAEVLSSPLLKFAEILTILVACIFVIFLVWALILGFLMYRKSAAKKKEAELAKLAETASKEAAVEAETTVEADNSDFPDVF
ncbi:MAG: hypothetical protein IJY82_00470 [Oscillospiraceae bacterium]|nr:hypothetical protein [Oscillospiraceae bacterium]MBQ8731288.1 hypothetical protein [Oscillospiraceae bacterium]